MVYGVMAYGMLVYGLVENGIKDIGKGDMTLKLIIKLSHRQNGRIKSKEV